MASNLGTVICPADCQDSSVLLKERIVLKECPSANPPANEMSSFRMLHNIALREFLPNKKTTLFTVPARSPARRDGSLAVVRVLQESPGASRISVESR